MEKFRQRIKELREEHGLSKKQLAKELGVSDVAIGRWENGIRIPSVEILLVYAKYFKVSTDYIMGLEEW